MSNDSGTSGDALHGSSLVIDGTCPVDWWEENYRLWLAGGASACVVTAVAWENCRDTMARLGLVHRFIRERDDLVLATTAGEIRDAKASGKLAVVLHFQGTQPIEYDANLIDLYHRLGVRVVQLTYNVRSPVGDGCEEPSDAGLSRFGRKVVGELNRTGIVVDVTHTGERTSLEAIDASSSPCIASHSNPRGVHPSARNISDDLVRALAGRGGVIGINGFPSFVAESPRPSLDQFIDHIAYVSDLVGPDHVALGIDYTIPDPPRALYDQFIDEGVWSADSYPPPPWHYPTGLDEPSQLPNVTRRLLERGFEPPEIRGLLGENWLRLFTEVWGKDD